MDLFYSLNNDFSNWLWSYRHILVTSWVAVLLVLYGNHIISLVKRVMQPYHYILRLSAFVLLCSIGFGLIAQYGEIAVNTLIDIPRRKWFACIVITTYVLLGYLAEKKNQA